MTEERSLHELSEGIEERSLQERIRHMSEYWSQYQADGIDARIPPESTHTSAIEARKYTALARAAKTELEATRYIQDALVHWKDFELYDEAIKAAGLSIVVKKLRNESRSR